MFSVKILKIRLNMWIFCEWVLKIRFTFTSAFVLIVIIDIGTGSAQPIKPNIVIILIDDMGFNDVSFHGSNQILTPNIDALGYNGIILNKLYVPNLCSPSRAALLTGKYPIHTGMQHFVQISDEPWGLPLKETLMPQLFRDAGYSTQLIGKWHLGFFRQDLTPTMRGFDHHYGYYNGYIDYYDHTHYMLDRNYSAGMDFRRDFHRWSYDKEIYATNAFSIEAQRVIKHHDLSRPLFMVLSHLAVHTGNEDRPMQAPKEEVDNFPHISNFKRRTYAGMISSLDKSVGQTMRALSDKGILNNTIVLLYSDNGAPTKGIHSNAGSNHPFRGQKESPWEGGIRSAAVIWSSSFREKGYVSNQVIHAIDWLPTLAEAAGVVLPTSLNLDGVNMWTVLSDNLKPKSRKLLHVLDDVFGYSSFMHYNIKYVNGSRFGGNYDSWLGHLDKREDSPNFKNYFNLVLSSEVHQVLGTHDLTKERIQELRTQATIQCPYNDQKDTEAKYLCEPLKSPCYFNLTNDPCERYNLAKLFPEKLSFLEQELNQLRLKAVEVARIPISDYRANPALHGYYWEWWNDTETNTASRSINKSNLNAINRIWNLCILFLKSILIKYHL